MSIYADDVVSFTSVLKIAYNFLTGRDYLIKKKNNEKKKLISVALGFPDLVFAADSMDAASIALRPVDETGLEIHASVIRSQRIRHRPCTAVNPSIN